jgi:hypothetical protein
VSEPATTPAIQHVQRIASGPAAGG